MQHYKHQKDIIDDQPKKTGLWLGTGSGKTLTAASMATGNTLVICPKTVKEDDTWPKAFEQVKQMSSGLSNEARGRVITKDQIKLPKNKWAQHEKWDTIIIDEAHQCAGVSPSTYQKHNIKYPKTSIIYQVMRRIIENNRGAKVFLLTATPTATPMVVYGLSKFLGKNYDFNEYRDFFYQEFKRNIYITKKGQKQKDRLALIVNDLGYVGRLQDYIDVPEQTYKTIDVGLTKAQVDALQEMRLIYPDPLVQLGKNHQIEQGRWNTDEDSFSLRQNKTDAILDLKHEFDRIVVYCKYSKQIDDYAEILGKKHKVYVLTGKTKNRGELFDKANNDDCILLVQSSISAGYELQGFDCMVFAGESYSFVDRIQAEGRILRANNPKKNLYVTLIAGEVDKAVRATVGNKEDFNEAVYIENNK